MEYVEYVLWAFFVGTPLYVYLTHEQDKRMLIAEPSKLCGYYRSGILYLCAPASLLIVLVYFNAISLDDLGLRWQWNLTTLFSCSFLLLLTLYFAFKVEKLKSDVSQQQELLKQLEFVAWFMPKDAAQARYFVLGLSVAAGVCEELLFRGYLLNALTDHMPVYAALIVSSLLFGLGHIYQGWVHVIRAALLGGILGGLYLLSESIVFVIYLHWLLDAYGGMLAYVCYTAKAERFDCESASART